MPWQNFFSTAFVNVVVRDDGSSLLVVASNWWIFLAGAIPLTGVTIYLWWFYVQREVHGDYPFWWQFLRRKCGTVIGTALTGWHRRNDVIDREIRQP